VIVSRRAQIERYVREVLSQPTREHRCAALQRVPYHLYERVRFEAERRWRQEGRRRG